MDTQAENSSKVAAVTLRTNLHPGPIQVPKTVPLISKKAPRSLAHSERCLGERINRDPYDRARKEQARSIKEAPPVRPKSNEVVRSTSDGSQESSAVLSALSELTSTLNKVVKRLEKTECRIQIKWIPLCHLVQVIPSAEKYL